jgi:hypothetical protein
VSLDALQWLIRIVQEGINVAHQNIVTAFEVEDNTLLCVCVNSNCINRDNAHPAKRFFNSLPCSSYQSCLSNRIKYIEKEKNVACVTSFHCSSILILLFDPVVFKFCFEFLCTTMQYPLLMRYTLKLTPVKTQETFHGSARRATVLNEGDIKSC